MKTKVLIDHDTILELLINRGYFEGNVKDLNELADKCKKNGIDLCISSYGLDLIKNHITHWKNPETSEDIIDYIKKKIKVLKVFKYIMEAIRNSPIKDVPSAVAVIFAQRKNIGAIVTLKPENFHGSDVNILSFSEFQKSQQLESLLQKNVQPSIVLRTSNSEQVSVLNRIYKQPSYSVTTGKHGDDMFCKDSIAKTLESMNSLGGLSMARAEAVKRNSEIIKESRESIKYRRESSIASRGMLADYCSAASRFGESIAKSLESMNSLGVLSMARAEAVKRNSGIIKESRESIKYQKRVVDSFARYAS